MISNEHRARLLQLAAHRGEKGFSPIIGEAIERYLAELDSSDNTRRRALQLCGSLSRREADRFRLDTAKILLGRYSFALPDSVQRGQLRPLRNPAEATE